MVFVIQQELKKLNTTTVVKVEAVNVDSRISPVGYVDVRPQIDQMDGNNKPVSHGIIYNVPYIRLQGGANAIIIDPQVGDIGICCFSDRDLSRFKEKKEPSLPGTKRIMSMADGLYIGGVMNEAPERYIIVEDSGIEINGDALVKVIADSVDIECLTASVLSDTSITMEAPTIDMTADTVINLTAPTINITADTALNLISSTIINLTSVVISALTGTITAADFATATINSLNAHGHAPGTFQDAEERPISGKSGAPS